MIDLTSNKIRIDIVKRKFFNEDDAFFNKLNITRSDYASPLGLHMYLRELSDGYYYTKKVSEFQLCNEIIGRYLCKKIGLNTTSLDLLLDEGKIKIATPNYKMEGLKYNIPKTDTDMLFSHHYNIKKLTLLSKAYQQEQYKLIALDTMMEQCNRSGMNMEEVICSHSIHLTPIIDFEKSFPYDPYFIYDNPYVCIPKNVTTIDSFLNDFPDVYQYIFEMFEIDYEELTSYIETVYPIKIADEIKEKYYKVTSKNQKILQQLR